jgi:Nup53/35/40-type RNA recognition motif
MLSHVPTGSAPFLPSCFIISIPYIMSLTDPFCLMVDASSFLASPHRPNLVQLHAATPTPHEPEPMHRRQALTSLENSMVPYLAPTTPILVENQNKVTVGGLESHSSPEIPPPLFSSDDGADRWVVAFGYTTSSEYHELLAFLSSFGTLQQQRQSSRGGNWLAVQYESRLAAERALCYQPITLGGGSGGCGNNTLCGTVRGTPALLRGLWTRNSSSVEGTTDGPSIHRRGGVLPPSSSAVVSSRGSRVADGSVWLNDDDVGRKQRTGNDRSDRLPSRTGICQKLVSWYFGWEYIIPDDEDVSDDKRVGVSDLQQHPHSD